MWTISTIGELAQSYKLGGNYTNSENETKAPLIKMGNLSRGYIKLKKIEYIPDGEPINKDDRIKEDDLFFNTRNTLELVGKVAVWRNELPVAYYNSNLMRIHFESNRFMNYKLNSFEGIKGLRRLATGTTSVAAIYTKDLIKLKQATPSLPEQEKIAAFLTSVDDRIDQLKRKKSLLQDYKKGAMQKLFSQELRFKDEQGKDFPDWEEKKLGEVGVFLRGISYNSTNVSVTGLFVLRSTNIQDQRLMLDRDFQFIDVECPQKISLKKGDIAICMSNGSKRLVGKSAVYDGSYPHPLTVGAFCSIFRTANCLAPFLLQTQAYSKYLHILLAGTNINNLKNSDLAELSFSIPSDSDEQTKIANFLSSLDQKIEQVDTQITQTQTFKKGLLQQMFV